MFEFKNLSVSDSFDLNQKVNFSTHIHRHTLDLLLTKSNNDHLSNVHTIGAFSDNFSDHKIDKEKKTDLLASELLNNLSKGPTLCTSNATLPCQPLSTNMHHFIPNTPR